MSVVILGGNECMERQYKDLCRSYKCCAKIFIKPSGSLKNKLGRPDLMICCCMIRIWPWERTTNLLAAGIT